MLQRRPDVQPGPERLDGGKPHARPGLLPPRLRRRQLLYQKACDAGLGRGCYNLAAGYEDGSGELPRDPYRAAELYQKGCDAEDTLACVNLGVMYEEGSGVFQDEARALALYRRACDGDEELGCSNLQRLTGPP